MLNGTLRYCSHVRCFNHVTVVTSNAFAETVTAFGSSRKYSNDKGSCCKDIAQTQGKKVEPWPKSDPPPPAWRVECPTETQPPNYDPYRIKVPDVVCQPIPPSNAKWTAVAWTTQSPTPTGGQQGEYQQPTQQHHGPGSYPNYGEPNAQASEEQSEEEPPPSTGFFGFLKGLFGRKGKGRGEGEEVPNEDSTGLFRTSAINIRSALNPMLDLFYNSPVVHPDYWKESETKLPYPANEIHEPLPRLGYHGKNKYKYAFHEPWKPLDRLTLLSQAEKQELGHTEDITDTEKY